jgi:hypothetical protein
VPGSRLGSSEFRKKSATGERKRRGSRYRGDPFLKTSGTYSSLILSTQIEESAGACKKAGEAAGTLHPQERFRSPTPPPNKRMPSSCCTLSSPSSPGSTPTTRRIVRWPPRSPLDEWSRDVARFPWRELAYACFFSSCSLSSRMSATERIYNTAQPRLTANLYLNFSALPPESLANRHSSGPGTLRACVSPSFFGSLRSYAGS